MKSLLMNNEHRDPQYIITLVHGTFALNAKWTQLDSFLRTNLESARRTSGSSVRFEVFNWPGLFGTRLNNGHRYRVLAGRNLALHIETVTTKYPNAQHFIIAHSHGGNVAYYALDSKHLQERIKGIVCLGTPFLKCVPRNFYGFEYHTIVLWLLSFVTMVVASVASFGVAVYFLYDFLKTLPQGITLLLAFIGIILWGSFALWWLEAFSNLESRFDDRLRFWLGIKQREILKRLRLPNLYGPAIFCAYTPGDEAGRHLVIARFLAGIPRWFWTLWFYLFLFFGTFAVGILWPQLVPDWIHPSPHHSRLGPTFDKALMTAFAIIISFSLLHAIIIVLVPWLLRGHGFAFGQEGILDNLLVNIGVSHEPEAGAVTSRSYAMRGFRHSGFYNDERVVSDIAEWMFTAPPNQWAEWEKTRSGLQPT
jgi:hypothetical protein